MTILVDSSVWISYLKGDGTKAAEVLDYYLEEGVEICVTGFIVTEVLQGIRSDVQHGKTQQYLRDFTWLDPDHAEYELAVDIYRSCLKEGITIRSTIDCIMSALCANRSLPILHQDRDFEQIAVRVELDVIDVDAHAEG